MSLFSTSILIKGPQGLRVQEERC